MQQVLEDICKRKRLDPSVHALKHKRNVLDSSLTVRFSGLSSNATLELVTAAPAEGHGSCAIALQLPSGERTTFTTDTAALLSQAPTLAIIACARDCAAHTPIRRSMRVPIPYR